MYAVKLSGRAQGNRAKFSGAKLPGRPVSPFQCSGTRAGEKWGKIIKKNSSRLHNDGLAPCCVQFKNLVQKRRSLCSVGPNVFNIFHLDVCIHIYPIYMHLISIETFHYRARGASSQTWSISSSIYLFGSISRANEFQARTGWSFENFKFWGGILLPCDLFAGVIVSNYGVHEDNVRILNTYVKYEFTFTHNNTPFSYIYRCV